MIKDDWYTVTQLSEETFAISEYGNWEEVHSFLIVGDERAALIDTGLGIKSIREIVVQLTDKPVIVMTTHAHWDHIGNHGEFQSIAIHEEDAEWLCNGIEGLSIEQVRTAVIRDLSKPLPKDFSIDNYHIYTGSPTLLLHDESIIDLGNHELVVIHSPGHSPGHICILDKKTHFLFTGDLLYYDAPIYACYPSTSPSDLVDSLFKVSGIRGVKRVFGSHHSLELDSDVLMEAKSAADYLRRHGLDTFGTGLHEFNRLSFLF